MLLGFGFNEIHAIGAKQGLGGPVSPVEEPEVATYLASAGNIEALSGSPDEDITGFIIESEAALMSPNHPLQDLLPLSRDGTITYKVEQGDTLSGIAGKFGISLDTILSANTKVSARIQIGQTLIILPIPGVLHTIEEGQTLDSIARLYGVDVRKVIAANSRLVEQNQIATGASIIVPGAKKRAISAATLAYRLLPNLDGYFEPPAAGWNWGELHAKNAVDIANVSGTPIYSAAEGLVVEVGSPAQWNDGYGGNVYIVHPNKTGTRYAHTQKNVVQVGDYVTKGQLIAYVGNTGNVHPANGGRGFHLHFEVYGARNPFEKR